MESDIQFIAYPLGTAEQTRQRVESLIAADAKANGITQKPIRCFEQQSFQHDQERAVKSASSNFAVVVPSLPHFAKSLKDLANRFEEMQKRNVALRVLEFLGEPFDSRNVSSSDMVRIFWAMAEFESDLARVRTHKAVQEAKNQGLSGRPSIAQNIKSIVLTDYNSGSFSVPQIAERHGIGRSTVFKIVKESKRG
jgi:DNA invertase Pin-like site-specific DNA recombinase